MRAPPFFLACGVVFFEISQYRNRSFMDQNNFRYMCAASNHTAVFQIDFSGLGWRSPTSDSLRPGQPRDRIPVGERNFPLPSRLALRPTHPPIQWVQILFPDGKVSGAWCCPSPLSSNVVVKQRVELHLYRSRPSCPVLG